jgi:DNA-binding XRE family transcriptional regulator
MSDTWTAEQRAKASRKAAARWHAKTLADPHATALARARAFRDLTQAELAQLSGVSVSAIGTAESGREVAPAIQGPRG